MAKRKQHTPSGSDEDEEAQLAPYELQRLEIMARNRKRLEELGILEAIKDLEALAKPASKPKKHRHTAAVKHEEPTEPTRRSRRLQEAAEGHTKQRRGGSVKEEEDGEEEEEAPVTPAKKHSAYKAVTLEDKLKELDMGGLVDLTEEHAKFVVLGSKGNHYTITLKDDGHKCECMDHRIRKRQCKHITLVLNSIGAGAGKGEWRQALDAGAATQGVKVDTQPVGVKVEKAEPVASVAHKFL